LNKIKKPETIHDVRRILGMLGYYHPYIKGFCDIMSPVFALLKGTKNSKRANKVQLVNWELQHQQAVNEAIELLKNSALVLPLATDKFQLETDASDHAIGAILSCQREDGSWSPVEFASKTLSPTERRWPVRDREAFAIIYGLKKFDPYLRGRSFNVNTDHQSLKWMLEAKEGRVARWASRLTEYDITICHKSGKEMEHVDYFSRFIDNSSDFDLEPRMSFSVNFLRTTENNLPTMKDIIAAQQEVAPPTSKGFFKKGGVIYYHSSIWVPPKLQHPVISACHSVIPYRHHKIKKTSRLIQRVFNWPGLHRDVIRYIASCLYCQRNRSGVERLQGLFRAHPVTGPFHTLYVDFYKCTFNGESHLVFTMIDQFTKWVECIAIPNRSTPVVLSAFVRNWVCRFGVPYVVVNDNDRTLLSDMVAVLHASFGTRNLPITPYHPEGNATIETFHCTLNKGLSSFLPSGRIGLSFDEALQLVLYSYRSTIHLTTGESPAYLTYGLDPRPPTNCDWRFERNVPMQQRLKFLNEMRLEIQWKAYDERLRSIDAKNKHRVPAEFELGQLVLVRATDYDKLRMAHAINEHSHKLIPKWSLPHRVIHVYPGNKKAMVRNLLTQDQKLVHIQNVRFLQPPQSHVQREEWDLIITKAIETMFDPRFRHEKLEQFWEAVDLPQLEVPIGDPPPKRRKRARTQALGES